MAAKCVVSKIPKTSLICSEAQKTKNGVKLTASLITNDGKKVRVASKTFRGGDTNVRISKSGKNYLATVGKGSSLRAMFLSRTTLTQKAKTALKNEKNKVSKKTTDPKKDESTKTRRSRSKKGSFRRGTRTSKSARRALKRQLKREKRQKERAARRAGHGAILKPDDMK